MRKEDLTDKFVHLHVHSDKGSNLRLLDSTNKIPDMVKYVASLGQNALAITDHESLSGHVLMLQTIEELKANNIIQKSFKPILGNEIYLTDEKTMKQEMYNEGKTTFYHFLLLAKDKKGHDILKKLSTQSWERSFSYKGMERVPTYYSDIEGIINKDKGHLIASTACLGGYFAQNILKILQEDDEDKVMEFKYKIHDFITWCIDIFGQDNFYIELQPSRMEEQIAFNKMALNIAKAYNLKWIVTTDAHYLRPEDREIHKAFLTSDKEGENNREVDDFYSSTHFFTVDMLFDYLFYLNSEDIEKAIINTYDIANQIEEYDLSHKQIIPKVVLPNEVDWFKNAELYHIAKEYEYINQLITSDEVNDRMLINLTLQGVKNKIKPQEYKETFERINIECKDIIGISKAKGEPVSAYFVTMVKNINIMWEDANCITMPSRGSAAGYIINYLVGITQINPLKQGIYMPHWRFISAERPDYPDIDTDYPSYKKDRVFECLKKYYQSIGGDVVRVATFGTETAKSAIQTACRGLKINSDVGLFLSSLIPVERGKVWSIEDCYYGNEEKDRRPITEFKNTVDKYDNLLKVALGVQGLVNKRSSHACGVLIVNEEFTKYNAKMKAPSGEIISQFDLHESEYLGNIKYDFLNTKTCAMIQKCLEMLVNHHKIEWQGSLRKTYDKYLSPDVIDTKSPEIWQKLNNGELVSAFQFDSMAGEQALKSIKPTNLLEAAAGNTLMRLMVADGEEQPLDLYVRYKNNISEWYKDMENFGLSNMEIDIMKKYLEKDYGVCATQESMMLLSMDKNIAGFNVKESNILRKSVAKKNPKLLQDSKDLLYENGSRLGTSKKMLDYVWDRQFSMQKGYSFSILHTIGYTYILIQQLNLIQYYPPVYWNTAVLLIESGAVEMENENLSNDAARKEKTTQYGTVAKAIGNMQDKGVSIALPNINTAEIGFTPNELNNAITFGFKGVMNINNDTAKIIIKNRPYESVEDFYKRMVLVKHSVKLKTGKIQNKSLVSESQLIMLVKAGAFDELENKPRKEILESVLRLMNPSKKSINTRNIEKVIEMGIVPTYLKDSIRFFRFREYVKTFNFIKDENTKSIKWYVVNDENQEIVDYTVNFFLENFANEMTEGEDYYYNEKGLLTIALGTTREGSFEKVYSNKMEQFNKWLKSKECMDMFNNCIFENIKSENMSGNISSWEMESMNFYYHEHELSGVNKEKYSIANYNELPEQPKTVGFTEYNGFKYPKFELSRIVGTVLDKDKTKHIVTLLTIDGVVTLKFYSGQFAFYDKQISSCDEESGKKITIEDGWFKRGTKLMVSGFRRGDQFKPKKYKNSIYQHTLQKILDIKPNGDLVLQSERIRED